MINILQKIFITKAMYFFRSSKVHLKRSSIPVTAIICQSGCPHQSICIRLYNYIRTKPCDDLMITQATKPWRCCPQAIQQVKQELTESNPGSLHNNSAQGISSLWKLWVDLGILSQFPYKNHNVVQPLLF